MLHFLELRHDSAIYRNNRVRALQTGARFVRYRVRVLQTGARLARYHVPLFGTET